MKKSNYSWPVVNDGRPAFTLTQQPPPTTECEIVKMSVTCRMTNWHFSTGKLVTRHVMPHRSFHLYRLPTSPPTPSPSDRLKGGGQLQHNVFPPPSLAAGPKRPLLCAPNRGRSSGTNTNIDASAATTTTTGTATPATTETPPVQHNSSSQRTSKAQALQPVCCHYLQKAQGGQPGAADRVGQRTAGPGRGPSAGPPHPIPRVAGSRTPAPAPTRCSAGDPDSCGCWRCRCC